MSNKVLISICIPAYKRTAFLQRALDSIAIQTFRDFEVIVTDDSPDNSVQTLCHQYQLKFSLQYFRNERVLGTPENWNEAIRRSGGEWLKLIHDDDWLADEHSLQQFASAIHRHPGAGFFFCAYRNVYLKDKTEEPVFVSAFRLKALNKNPATLFSRNVIGPPSVTLHRNTKQLFYDARTKWVVDIDFYMRWLAAEKPVYIPQVLVNVGISEEQVTQESFRRRAVEIPENFLLLNKVGVGTLQQPLVYDAWWRLMRNLAIANTEELREAGYNGEVHPVIASMIRWQRAIPRSLLKIGIVSKSCMFIHYLLHRNQVKQ